MAGGRLEEERAVSVMLAENAPVHVVREDVPKEPVARLGVLEDAADVPDVRGSLAVHLGERSRVVPLERLEDIGSQSAKRRHGVAESAYDPPQVAIENHPFIQARGGFADGPEG